jgi:hypothetical protein
VRQMVDHEVVPSSIENSFHVNYGSRKSIAGVLSSV